MGSVVQWVDNSWYSAYAKNWDDAIPREGIIAHIGPDSVVFDPRAGVGIVAQMNFKEMNFKGLAQKVWGVDLDERVVDNPMLHQGRVSDK